MRIINTISTMVVIAAALRLAACDSRTVPCSGGCPTGQVCDYQSGRCVAVRPPETPPDLGRYNSVALDSAGRLVVASYAARYGDLVLGREREGEALEWEYVDGLPDANDPALLQDPPPIVPGPDVGLYASLRLDALDRPHLAYFDRTHGRLKYAVRTAGGWQIEPVPLADEDDPLAGRGASLVLGPDGLAQIAFLDERLGGVMLASKLATGGWKTEQISACDPGPGWDDSGGVEPGRLISLVLDRRHSPWIAYHDPCSGSARLASRSADGFSWLELASGPDAGNWISAALDGDGNVAVALHDRSEGSLRFAFNQGGTMRTLELDRGRMTDPTGAEQLWPVGQHCALVFGHDGLARIVYLDGQNLDLKLVVGLPGGGFGEPTVLDEAGAVGLFNALVLGSDDLRVVSYRVARDELGASCGELVRRRVDGGAQRLGSRP